MILLLKNLLFTLVVPGTIGVYVPLFLARDRPAAAGLMFLFALALLALGGVIYAWCVWDFAVFGRGTPAPIDAPKKFVVSGLYRLREIPSMWACSRRWSAGLLCSEERTCSSIRCASEPVS